jgi:menaquinone-dependent protoporphyrinogen IX oxidase
MDMGKTAVIYQSKYGSSKKYAEWLSEEIHADLFKKSEITLDKIKEYDTVIYGAGIYASGIAGFSLIKKNYSMLKDKNLVIFAVGASPQEEGTVPAIKKVNFTEEMKDVPCFYLRGAFDEDKMNMGDRMLIKMLKKMVGKKDPSKYENWEKALMESIGKPADWTSKENLMPLIDYINKKR